MRLSRMNCYGMRELSGLANTPSGEAAMNRVCQSSALALMRSHIVFSAAGSRALYGERFAAYIKANKLGTVIASKRKTNPNSGNPLKCWIWTIDHKS